MVIVYLLAGMAGGTLCVAAGAVAGLVGWISLGLYAAGGMSAVLATAAATVPAGLRPAPQGRPDGQGR
jgi:hypothetical protein